mgnify:CR=1 FL=1
MKFETALKAMPENLGENPFPLEHFFADGLYARKITRPKGSLIVGKIHKYKHFYFLLQGAVTTLTENGVVKMEAPAIVVTPAGTKRVSYAREDVIIVTVHATEKTDIDKIEDEIIASSFEELDIRG